MSGLEAGAANWLAAWWGGGSEGVHQQPHPLGRQIGVTFIRILKNIFRFRKIANILNSLPGQHNLLIILDIAYENSSSAIVAPLALHLVTRNAVTRYRWRNAMALAADRMKAMRERRHARGLRELRLIVPDARSKVVRRRIAKEVAGLDGSRELDALGWIEAVSEFDAR